MLPSLYLRAQVVQEVKARSGEVFPSRSGDGESRCASASWTHSTRSSRGHGSGRDLDPHIFGAEYGFFVAEHHGFIGSSEREASSTRASAMLRSPSLVKRALSCARISQLRARLSQRCIVPSRSASASWVDFEPLGRAETGPRGGERVNRQAVRLRDFALIQGGHVRGACLS